MSTEVDRGGRVSVFHGKSSPVFQATSDSYAKKVAKFLGVILPPRPFQRDQRLFRVSE